MVTIKERKIHNYRMWVSSEIIRHIPTAEYIFTGHWGYTDDYKMAIAN